MLKLGNKYKWKDITDNYPDMYAIITDIEKKDGEIISCTLLDVAPYERINGLLNCYYKQGKNFDCKRTTFKAPNVGVFY